MILPNYAMNKETAIAAIRSLKMNAGTLQDVLAIVESIEPEPRAYKLAGDPPDADLKRRINKLYTRRETTRWSDKETQALKKAQIDPQDLAVIERARALGYTYYRRDILTLLNNFNAETDRCRDYIANEA